MDEPGMSFREAVEGRCSVRRFGDAIRCRATTCARWCVWRRARRTPATRRCGASWPSRAPAVRAAMLAAVEAALDEIAAWPEAAGQRSARSRRSGVRRRSSPPRRSSSPSPCCRTSRTPTACSRRTACSREERDRLRQRPDIQSVGAAVQLLVTAAHAMGYGSCWMSAPVLAAERLEAAPRHRAAGAARRPRAGRPAGGASAALEAPAGRRGAAFRVKRRGRRCAGAASCRTRCGRATVDLAVEPPAAVSPDRGGINLDVGLVTMASDRRRILDVTDRALAGLPLGLPDIAALLAIDDRGDAGTRLRRRTRAARASLRRQRLPLRVRLLLDLVSQRLHLLPLPARQPREPALPQGASTRSSTIAVRSWPSRGVHLIDLTMGEDPLFFDDGDFGPLVDLVAAVKARDRAAGDDLAGRRRRRRCSRDLHDAGADWYACYQETHVPDVYARLRMGQDFDERVARARRGGGARHARRGRPADRRRRAVPTTAPRRSPRCRTSRRTRSGP